MQEQHFPPCNIIADIAHFWKVRAEIIQESSFEQGRIICIFFTKLEKIPLPRGDRLEKLPYLIAREKF